MQGRCKTRRLLRENGVVPHCEPFPTNGKGANQTARRSTQSETTSVLPQLRQQKSRIVLLAGVPLEQPGPLLGCKARRLSCRSTGGGKSHVTASHTTGGEDVVFRPKGLLDLSRRASPRMSAVLHSRASVGQQQDATTHN